MVPLVISSERRGLDRIEEKGTMKDSVEQENGRSSEAAGNRLLRPRPLATTLILCAAQKQLAQPWVSFLAKTTHFSMRVDA